MKLFDKIFALQARLNPDKYVTQEIRSMPSAASVSKKAHHASDIYAPAYIKQTISEYKTLRDLVKSFNLPDECSCTFDDVLTGIVCGDMYGSPYEFVRYGSNIAAYLMCQIKTPGDWTDDSIMTWATYIAVDKIHSYQRSLTDQEKLFIFSMTYRDLARQFPAAGYGGGFYDWAVMGIDREEYISYGDGSAMRAGIIGILAKDIQECIALAVLSALPTHSHPEGIKGAVAAAVCTYIAAHGGTKEQIKEVALFLYPSGAHTQDEYNSLKEDSYIAPDCTLVQLIALEPKTMSASCQVTVPIAIALFLNSSGYLDFITYIQNIALDADTVGAIGGSIAGAFYHNFFGMTHTDISAKGSAAPFMKQVVKRLIQQEDRDALFIQK